MNQPQVTITVLPVVGSATQLYMTIIFSSNNTFNEVFITSISTIYGNAILHQPNIFIPLDTNGICLQVNGEFNGEIYSQYFYTNAIAAQQTPNNTQRITQKIPLGIFTDINSSTIIGQIIAAKANMADDYYSEYFYVTQQVFSNVYSPQLEYEYNGTIGLLSTSVYPNQLFELLSSANIVALNSYDLELFFSKYIYYRLGISCAVYVYDIVINPGQYWLLGNTINSVLGITTILASSVGPVIPQLKWMIYNAGSFTAEFQTEIINLINRFSRADIGNTVAFSNIVNLVDDGFTLIGPTYPLDPRILYGKCLRYLGDAEYPLNVIAYIKNQIQNYWILNNAANSILGTTTLLAVNAGIQPIL